MLIKMLMVLLMVLSIGYSQETGKWRWADDTNEFKMDKKAHFATSGGLYFMFRQKDFTEKQSILYSFYFGLAKETIDALVPWEIHGSIGGDGFSKYDLAYDLAGILCAWGVDKIWKPKENSKWERGFNHIGFSISYRFY